jgi:hypothetical protein
MAIKSITIIGSGSEVLTRATRRSARFPRRAFTIGSDLSIRPGARRDVRPELIKRHLPQVCEAINNGTIRCMVDGRAQVTSEELISLLTADLVQGEVLLPVEPLASAKTEPETKTEPEGAGTDENTGSGEDGKTEETTETEPSSEPDAPPPADAPPAPPVSSEEPEAAAESPKTEEPAATAPDAAETASAAPTASTRASQLPEDWRTFTKAQLTVLISQLGIEVSERANKTELTEAVEAWAAG